VNTTNIITTNGTIVTVTRIHHFQPHYGLIALAVLALACIGSGLYLMFRKEKV
jgi:hypothetical protein